MDLEVVGRHALLFDDDAMAEFVNSPAALVDWNSLSIDRYDVRHLLSAPPPPRSHLRRRPPPDPLAADLDRERYLDLLPETQDSEQGAESDIDCGYHTVSFSYGNPSESTDPKSTDAEFGFRPPFPVPENLFEHLPPTEKVHQIIARTATFVSKHGGQSEIVLRVKQGDNPTFGFLMPDHNLHPYFSFLVDHQELLKSETDGKSVEEDGKTHGGYDQIGGFGGSLSLLGSLYGSGEDEEGATEAILPPAKENSVDAPNANNTNISRESDRTDNYLNAAGKDASIKKISGPISKEKTHVIKKNRSISTVQPATTTESQKGGDTYSVASSSLAKMEAFILEPPSDMKRVVDKIVEFILRNGREFEAVLVQQDIKHGRFPFLIPSHQYHPYYLKVLQKTQESRTGGKGLLQKHDSTEHGGDRKTSSKTSDVPLLATDIPCDSDRKEKFKMVIGKSKKDSQDSAPKAAQSQVGVSVDADAAAAILQAATKGIKNPNLNLLSRSRANGINQGPSSEGGGLSTSNSLLLSQPQNIMVSGISAPVAKSIAKTVATEAASEADSSEASLTRKQKLKNERLKRAKMFSAMIKSGAAPLKNELSRGLSIESPEPGCSGSAAGPINIVGKERENSVVPSDTDHSGKSEKLENKGCADTQNERRSKRSYRRRSKRDEDDEEDDADAGDREEEVEEDNNHKHAKKKRRSHRSSHRSRDRHKHRSRMSSSKEKDSRSKHKHSSPDDDECPNGESSSGDENSRYMHKHKEEGSSSDEYRYSKHRKKHDISSEGEHWHSKHKSGSRHSRHERKDKYRSSSDDEHRYRDTRYGYKDEDYSDFERHHLRHKKIRRERSRSEREADLEEGEILTKSDQSRGSVGRDDPSREASADVSRSKHDTRAPSQPSEFAEVSDDLRAKIRAMLRATM